MKTKIFSTIATFSLLLGAQACHDPEELVSNGDPKGILGLTAKIVGDDSSENNFSSIIDYDNHTITVVFPYNYPRPSDELFDIENAANCRLTASLATNARIEPALTTLDLRKENRITVTNAQKERLPFTIKSEIRKSEECELKELELANGTVGIVDNVEHKVYLVTADDTVDPQTAEYEVSYHATVVPDIAVEDFDYLAEDAKITVVAQNGVDKQEYTFTKGEPNKLRYGIREGSVKLLWDKPWNEVGLTKADVQRGMAISGDYLVLNETGVMQAVILNLKNGRDTGKRLDMSGIINGLNYTMTSDEAGHILVMNKWDNKNYTKIWLFRDIDSQPEILVNGNIYGTGSRISAFGDVTKDGALIMISEQDPIFYRYRFIDGVMQPVETVKVNGLTGNPWGSWDVALINPLDPKTDYFMSGNFYYNNQHYPLFINGTNNVVGYNGLITTWKTLDEAPKDSENWNKTANDYKVFNNSQFFFYNVVNAQTWGVCDMLWLMDVSGGNLETHAIDFTEKGLNLDKNVGAKSLGNQGCGGGCNDVRLSVSSNGFFMYAIYQFTNGHVGCVRVDCIKY